MLIDLKRRALHRTKILQGQLKGLEKMIDSDDYCMEIITQSRAIQRSLGSLNKLIVENHLKTHVKSSLSSDEKSMQSNAIKELLDIYELTQVRNN